MDALSAAIVNVASTQAQTQLRTAVATEVLKKALDTQAANALQLLAAVQTPAPAGNSLDTRGALLDVRA